MRKPDRTAPSDTPADLVRLHRAVELVFYGQMGLTAGADAILAQAGYGRAHYRACYVIARNPGITTNALLAKLRITGQSLSRVMGPLVRQGLVVQAADTQDRRQRHHHLSAAGSALEAAVLAAQFDALRGAIAVAGDVAADGFLRMLNQLAHPDARRLLTDPLDDEPGRADGSAADS